MQSTTSCSRVFAHAPIERFIRHRSWLSAIRAEPGDGRAGPAGARVVGCDRRVGRRGLTLDNGPSELFHGRARRVKRLLAFDLDGTLAESKQPLGDQMAASLSALLAIAMVAVISGGDWPQLEKQVVSRLPRDVRLDRLFIMPTTGAKLFRFSQGAWRQVYAQNFSTTERERILAALDQAVAEARRETDQLWGPRVEDRGSQITFSALGQAAPLDAKKAWDPDMSRRQALQRQLSAALPDLSVKIGGSTSIDITRPGIDKAFAIARLVEHAGVLREEILFLGDAIYPGGNDEPVRAAGVDSIRVRDPAETVAIVDALVAWGR